jgi:glucose-1-phosphate thymidylyltransferase
MTKRKGIILAGGSGTRLYPITIGVSKQLLPIYDKPMIYYPISVLMLAGIREIAIITTPEDQAQFSARWAMGGNGACTSPISSSPRPTGWRRPICWRAISWTARPRRWCWATTSSSATACPRCWRGRRGRGRGTVFGYRVADPERYGVVDFGPEGEARAIIEKPKVPPSSYAVTGLYFLDGTAPERASEVKPSARGELEITSLLESYLRRVARRAEDGPRFRVARHRDPCEPSGCRELRAHADRTAGHAERIARGNRLCAGLDHRRSTARAYQFVYQERLWRLPEIPALRAGGLAAAPTPPGDGGGWSLYNRLRALFLRYASHHEARACGAGLPRHRLRRVGNIETRLCKRRWRAPDRVDKQGAVWCLLARWDVDVRPDLPRPMCGGASAAPVAQPRVRRGLPRRRGRSASVLLPSGRRSATSPFSPAAPIQAYPAARRRRRAFCRDMIRALPAFAAYACAGGTRGKRAIKAALGMTRGAVRRASTRRWFGHAPSGIEAPPPFTIIMPVHNGFDPLREALDRVAGHTMATGA